MNDDWKKTENNKPGASVEQFIRLVINNHKRIYAYILSLVPNHNDADDIMQETSTLMWSKFAQFEPDSDFFAWARTIAYYKVLNFRRQRAHSPINFSDELLELLHKDYDGAAKNSERQLDALDACMEKLDDKSRYLIHLRYSRSYCVKDIADRLGRNIKTVYYHLTRVQQMLLRCINRIMEGSLAE